MERRQRLFWGDKNGSELGKKGGQKRKKNGRLCACAEDEIESSLTSDNTPLLSAKQYIYILKKRAEKITPFKDGVVLQCLPKRLCAFCQKGRKRISHLGWARRYFSAPNAQLQNGWLYRTGWMWDGRVARQST